MADIEEFLTGRRSTPRTDRVLAMVLFTDIVGSTEQLSKLGDARWRSQLEEHNRVVREGLRHWRGHQVKTSGDGFLAMFDGPAGAVNCAAEIVDGVALSDSAYAPVCTPAKAGCARMTWRGSPSAPPRA